MNAQSPRLGLSIVAALLVIASSSAYADPILTYEFTATTPASLPAPWGAFAGVTIEGTFDVDQGSVLPVGDSWGEEGSTVLQPLSMTLSNGESTTATRNWYVKDFTADLWLIATRGEASVAGGNLTGYFDDVDAPFTPTSSILFDDLAFFLPKSSVPGSDIFSSGAPLDLTGAGGQIGLVGFNTSIGITLLDVTVASAPAVPASSRTALAILGLLLAVVLVSTRRLTG